MRTLIAAGSIAAVALVLGACGKKDAEAEGAFVESDLAEIVRGASDDLTLVEAESGPQTLAQLAEEGALDLSSVRRCGFVAASEAMFEGAGALPSVASGRLFRTARDAACYLRVVQETFAADVESESEPLDATSFGPEAIGFTTTLSGFFEFGAYFWQVDNLVLEVAAPLETARSFADRLDERAKAIR